MNAKEWIEYLRSAKGMQSQPSTACREGAPVNFQKAGGSPQTGDTLADTIQIPAIPVGNSYICFVGEKYFCSGYQDNEQEIMLHVMDYNRLLPGIAGNSTAKVQTGMAAASFRCPQPSRSGPIFLWVMGNGASDFESN